MQTFYTTIRTKAEEHGQAQKQTLAVNVIFCELLFFFLNYISLFNKIQMH